MYAAYCSGGGGQICSHVTAVGLLQDLDIAVQLQCALWYEESPQHLQGLLSLTTDKMGVTTFTCESKYPNKTPYAVAFYKGKGIETQTSISMITIFEPSSYFRTTASSTDPAISHKQIFDQHLHSA